MTGNELGLKKFPKLAENYIYESSLTKKIFSKLVKSKFLVEFSKLQLIPDENKIYL